MRRLSIEASDPPSGIDLSEADEWRVLVTLYETPCQYFRIPSPGLTSRPGIVDAALVRHADGPLLYNQFIDELQRRLGAPERSYRKPTVSVVVCTHRRPTYIVDLLRALQGLDPVPDEIVIVDNDPGDLDCRSQVESMGALYVREDRRGLDNARNAGLRAARSELVAFTDDDCVPSVGWLRLLPELFDDPVVAAVTGPGFAYALDTPSQVRFEETGGFSRGLKRRAWDWSNLPPVMSSAAGAGANMIYRRSVLLGLGEVFPPELDAGTATQSGGDMYAMYKVLAAGHRIVYDPATYIYHQHRPDQESLHKTFWGYGVGLSAALAKLLVEEREISVPRGWRWLWDQYLWSVRQRLSGRADATHVRIGWDHLRGGLAGARAWWIASRELGGAGGSRSGGCDDPVARKPSQPIEASAARNGQVDAAPTVSVIVPTAGRAEPLRRCLGALAAQDEQHPSFEVVVVDDTPKDHPGVSRAHPTGLDVCFVDGGGVGAAAARNVGAEAARGHLLLFLDDDLVPQPQLVERHVRRHDEAPTKRLVIGYSPPAPPRRNLAAQRASMWWEDHFRAKAQAIAITFTHVLSGNVSIDRTTFLQLGGFDASIGTFRREDWEWGIRALNAGVDAVYEPSAVAPHEFSLETGGWLQAARLEGHGDALLLARWPQARPSLPAGSGGRWKNLRHPAGALVMLLMGGDLAQGIVARALDLLEAVKARSLWVRLFNVSRRAAYLRGRKDGGAPDRAMGTRSDALRIELTSTDPIPAPTVVTPVVELTINGRFAGRFEPTEGHWDGSVAEQAAAVVPTELWKELPLERGTRHEDTGEGRDLAGTAVVFGPAHSGSDQRHGRRLEAAGAEVRVTGVCAENHWGEIDAAVRACSADVVAFTLPGVRPAPEWLSAARIALYGDRVAAAVGVGVERGEAAGPLVLASRRTAPLPYTLLGSPPQYVVVRRNVYENLGGIDLSTATLGPYAPVLDLLERCLDANYVIAYRETPGLHPPGATRWALRPAIRLRRRARAGLLFRRAVAMGTIRGSSYLALRGILPVGIGVWRSIRSRRNVRDGLSALGAFCAGTMAAARDPEMRKTTSDRGARSEVGTVSGPGPYASEEASASHGPVVPAMPLEGPYGGGGHPEPIPAAQDVGASGD